MRWSEWRFAVSSEARSLSTRPPSSPANRSNLLRNELNRARGRSQSLLTGSGQSRFFACADHIPLRNEADCRCRRPRGPLPCNRRCRPAPHRVRTAWLRLGPQARLHRAAGRHHRLLCRAPASGHRHVIFLRPSPPTAKCSGSRLGFRPSSSCASCAGWRLPRSISRRSRPASSTPSAGLSKSTSGRCRRLSRRRCGATRRRRMET